MLVSIFFGGTYVFVLNGGAMHIPGRERLINEVGLIGRDYRSNVFGYETYVEKMQAAGVTVSYRKLKQRNITAAEVVDGIHKGILLQQ